MRVLIFGGAGFIGTNAARRFQGQGHEVAVFDNLSRRGARANLEWLRCQGPVEFIEGDVRDFGQVRAALQRSSRPAVVLHLAAQVAVTTSVSQPRLDFEVNALGSFNVLEGVRAACPEALLIFASTNKVYGGMEQIAVDAGPGTTADEGEGRYVYRDLPEGISEAEGLDFHSPYGCSKGAADQYVRDYARIYGMRTVVFRQSCIYGPRQFGIEDQGWVAWFVILAASGLAIRIYGDGKQVRDLLHVEDLLDAYEAAIARGDEVAGKVYNVGGGRTFSRSVLGLVHQLERMQGRSIDRTHLDWRPGDQLVYISDIRKAAVDLGWVPKIDPEAGVESLNKWTRDNRELIHGQLGDLLAAK